MLRDAGIEVRCGLLANEARELNIGFVSRMTRGRPWVRMKVAASLDGRTGLPTGPASGSPAKRRAPTATRGARARRAILTGIGTVREDDPRLDVRVVDDAAPAAARDGRQSARRAAGRAILAGAPHADLLRRSISVDADRARALRERGVEIVQLLPTRRGKVDLPAMLADLGRARRQRTARRSGRQAQRVAAARRLRRRAARLSRAEPARQRARSMVDLGAARPLERPRRLNFQRGRPDRRRPAHSRALRAAGRTRSRHQSRASIRFERSGLARCSPESSRRRPHRIESRRWAPTATRACA